MINILKVRILPASTNFILLRNMEQLVENLICYVFMPILVRYASKHLRNSNNLNEDFLHNRFFNTPEWFVRFLWNFVFQMDATLSICHRVDNKTRQGKIYRYFINYERRIHVETMTLVKYQRNIDKISTSFPSALLCPFDVKLT